MAGTQPDYFADDATRNHHRASGTGMKTAKRHIRVDNAVMTYIRKHGKASYRQLRSAKVSDWLHLRAALHGLLNRGLIRDISNTTTPQAFDYREFGPS